MTTLFSFFGTMIIKTYYAILTMLGITIGLVGYGALRIQAQDMHHPQDLLTVALLLALVGTGLAAFGSRRLGR